MKIQIQQLEQSYLDRTPVEIATQLQQLYQNLEELAAIMPESYIKENFTSSISTIQQQLSTRQTVVEYKLTDKSIFIFTVSKNQFQVYHFEKPNGFEKELVQLYEALQQANAATAQITYNTLALEFYQALIEPLKLPEKQELIIVPDGVLRYLPFEALLTAPAKIPHKFKNRQYLLLQHDISYAYSSDLWLQGTSPSKGNGKVLAFAPSFENDYRQLPPLPYSQIELKSVHRITGAKQYVENTALESTFKIEAPNYSVLHLSTHGILDNHNPEYSHLAFSQIPDGLENEKLFVTEIYKLNLAADLVVLSACKTQLGKMYRGEGLMSIARAFTYAGAKSVVASLWSIDDAQTGQLMKYFYEKLKKQSKHKALNEAKRQFLLENPSKTHPYYWSACVLIGDVTEVNLSISHRTWVFAIFLVIIVLVLLGLVFWKRSFFNLRLSNTAQ